MSRDISTTPTTLTTDKSLIRTYFNNDIYYLNQLFQNFKKIMHRRLLNENSLHTRLLNMYLFLQMLRDEFQLSVRVFVLVIIIFCINKKSQTDVYT